jgi:hypothetical protein
MKFYTSGNFYPQLPQVIHDLPLDLLRSRAYPRNPEVLERGLRELEQGERPIFYAPGRMAYSKWKTPPVAAGFGQNVISMLGAVRAQLAVIGAAQPTRIPFMDAIQAGRAVGADRMPEPTDNMSPNLYRGYVPLSRGAVPLDDVVDVAAIDQVAADASNPEDLRNDARVSALESIGAYQDRLQMLAFANTGTPWFLR